MLNLNGIIFFSLFTVDLKSTTSAIGVPTTVIVSSNNSNSTLSDLSPVTATSYRSHQQHEHSPPDNDDMHATSSATGHHHHHHHSPVNGYDNMIPNYGYCNTGPYETYYPQTYAPLPPYTGKFQLRRIYYLETVRRRSSKSIILYTIHLALIFSL